MLCSQNLQKQTGGARPVRRSWICLWHPFLWSSPRNPWQSHLLSSVNLAMDLSLDPPVTSVAIGIQTYDHPHARGLCQSCNNQIRMNWRLRLLCIFAMLLLWPHTTNTRAPRFTIAILVDHYFLAYILIINKRAVWILLRLELWNFIEQFLYIPILSDLWWDIGYNIF